MIKYRRSTSVNCYPYQTSSIKILDVTILNKLSVGNYITNIVSKCSQTLYALTILRAHGLCDSALQSVYRWVVVARLLYACNAWWGFTTSADRQRLAGFVRRGVRRRFCSPDLITLTIWFLTRTINCFTVSSKTNITFYINYFLQNALYHL